MLTIDGFLAEIAHNAIHHPDSSRKNLYIALQEQIHINVHLSTIVFSVIDNRKDIDDKHLANLITHAFEMFFIEGIIEHEQDYWKFSHNDWKEIIDTLMEVDRHKSLIKTTLLEKKTQTNKFQRYLGPKLLINMFFDNNPIIVADGGCSLNLGLKGLKENKIYNPVIDNTSNNIVIENAEKPINISQGFGIDLTDPTKEEEWILACNFYPGEVHELPEFKKELNNYKKNKHPDIEFIQGNILVLNKIWKERELPKVDMLIENTILYQLPDIERKEAIKKGMDVIKNKGLYVITDFAKPVEGKISWDKKWFGEGPSYITSVIIKDSSNKPYALEFLKWNNARCKEVHEGKDFIKILEIAKQY